MEQFFFRFLALERYATDRGLPLSRAREIGLVAAMMQGNLGLIAGFLVANNEEPPAPSGKPPVPVGSNAPATARRTAQAS